MYTPFGGCLGTTTNLGPLARNDYCTSVRGKLDILTTPCAVDVIIDVAVVALVVDVPVVADVTVIEWSDILCVTIMV